MENQLSLLRQLIDAADIEAAQSEYAARNGMEIDGEVSCSTIRAIFGWGQTEAASALRRAMFGEV